MMIRHFCLSLALMLPFAGACASVADPEPTDSDDAELSRSALQTLSGVYEGTGVLARLELTVDRARVGYVLHARIGADSIVGSYTATKRKITLRFDTHASGVQAGEYTYTLRDGTLTLSRRGSVVHTLSGAAPGEACGTTTCGAGLVCCNASCGICTAPGDACIQRACAPEPPPSAAPCIRTGCSGQGCSDTPGPDTTCEWKESYACYQAAACERQPDGACGITPSAALDACLAAAK